MLRQLTGLICGHYIFKYKVQIISNNFHTGGGHVGYGLAGLYGEKQMNCEKNRIRVFTGSTSIFIYNIFEQQ